MHTILAVDDEPNYLFVLTELFREEGFEVLTAQTGLEAMDILDANEVDLVITDMRMPGMDGISLLQTIKEKNSDLPVIMVTAFGEVDKAVTAMRAGAYTYLTKPFNNDELVVNVQKALEHYDIVRENRRLRSEVKKRYSFASIIGRNERMREIYELIAKVAPTPASVLITGESGTGKELVARAIHQESDRDAGVFVSVNCAALPENLLESELFGHEKGAFTGAVGTRKGRFEMADKGTLFLDEIGEIPLHLQSKLLRALQERQFERVGGSKTITVDVRIIAATNRDLKEDVEKKSFREDLYYRLNVVQLHLPPLRERPDDIPMLAGHFLEKYGQIFQKPDVTISDDAMRALKAMPWEGNVRELENTVERALILCNGSTIEEQDVARRGSGEEEPEWEQSLDVGHMLGGPQPLPDILATIERKMVKEALAEAGYVQARAAERLGITKSLLQYKMKKFGIKKQG